MYMFVPGIQPRSSLFPGKCVTYWVTENDSIRGKADGLLFMISEGMNLTVLK